MPAVRVHSREFRLHVVRRVLSGEKVPALSDELGIHRKLLYSWIRQVSEGGESSLRERGRPRKMDRAARPADSGPQRLAELERLVVQQNQAIEFLGQALQRVGSLQRSKREWRESIFQTMELMMAQGGFTVEGMCELAQVARSGYYRYLRTRGGSGPAI